MIAFIWMALNEGLESRFFTAFLIACILGLLLSSGGFILSVRQGFDQAVLERFQVDVKVHTEKEHGLLLPVAAIQPDLAVRLTHATRGNATVPAQIRFTDEDSPLKVHELTTQEQLSNE